MASKNQLAKLLSYMGEQMAAFPDFLTREQHNESGREDAWAAKDNLFHSLYWAARQLENIERFERGEGEVENADNDFEIVNKEIFHVYKDRTWEDARSMVDETYQGILDYLEKVDDDRLSSPRHGRERPIWRDIVGSFITHPMIHLWEQLIKAGNIETLTRIFGERYQQMVLELDDSENYQGEVFYNQACLFALSGQAEKAVHTLDKALEMVPALIEWSQQDSDLDSLRELPSFKALYK